MSEKRVVLGLFLACTVILGLAPRTGAEPIFIDNFSVIRNSSAFFNDTFGDDTPPPNAPTLAYGTLGIMQETDGKVRLDRTDAAIVPGFAVSNFFYIERGTITPSR